MNHRVLIFAGFLTSVISVSEVVAGRPEKKLVARNANGVRKRKKWVIPVAVATAVLLAGAGVGGYAWYKKNKSKQSPESARNGAGQSDSLMLLPQSSAPPVPAAPADLLLRLPMKGNSTIWEEARPLGEVLGLKDLADRKLAVPDISNEDKIFFRNPKDKQELIELMLKASFVPCKIFCGFLNTTSVSVLLFVDDSGRWKLFKRNSATEVKPNPSAPVTIVVARVCQDAQALLNATSLNVV